MDGTLGSQTALMLDGSGVRITSGEELAEIILAGAAAGLPGRGARDRRRREPRGARRVRADTRRSGRRSACATGSSMRSCSRRRISPASPRSASPARCSSRTRPSDRDLADRFWAGKTDGAYAYRSLSTRAPSSPTARTRRSRSSTRSPASARASGGRSTTARPGIPSRRSRCSRRSRRRRVAPAWLTRRRAPARPPDPRLRRRPGRARPRPVGRPRRRGRRDDGRGRWVHNPPPWD